MKVLKSGLDKNIQLNTETSFQTNLGWEENIQEFEKETLQSIINPAVNYETGRYVHSPYVSNSGITQNDIWFQFYFYNNQTHNGGLNYDFVNITPQENRLLLRDTTESFFRLEFYKVPFGETPDRSNRRLVFSKNLTIPLGEKVFYKPVSDYIFVPIFNGSNYRNKENMYLFWFLDDTVLADTSMTGDTFYMTARFFNAKDGSILNFTNKPIRKNGIVKETDDTYYKLKLNQNDLTYQCFTFSGLTDGNRIGKTTTPIKFYEAIGGNETFNIPAWKGSNITDPDKYISCGEYNNTHSYYISGTTIHVGTIIYINPDLTTTYNGNDEWLTLSFNNSNAHYSCLIDTAGVVNEMYICKSPCGIPFINTVSFDGSDYIITFTNDPTGQWFYTDVEYSSDGGTTWTSIKFEPNINPISLQVIDNPHFFPIKIRIAKICDDNESLYSNVIDMDVNITTGQVTAQNINTASLDVSVLGDMGSSITERGICWSTGSTPTINDTKRAGRYYIVGTFPEEMYDLVNGSTYNVRGYLTNSFGTYYGNIVSYTHNYIRPDNYITLKSEYTVTDPESPDIVNIWAESEFMVLSDINVIITDIEGNDLNLLIYQGASISSNYTYETWDGTIIKYINELDITQDNYYNYKFYTVPILSTNTATNIDLYAITSGGHIIGDGGKPITTNGICYSNGNTTPTTSDNVLTVPIGTTNFTIIMSGLVKDTSYSIRSFATNSIGTGYGEVIHCSTLSDLITFSDMTPPTNVTYKSFDVSGSTLTSAYGIISERGFCWGDWTNHIPTVLDNKVPCGTGIGTFNTTITGLVDNTRYYVRQYGKNGSGIYQYGGGTYTDTIKNDIEMGTNSSLLNVTINSLTVDGNVMSIEHGSVVSRGLCWNIPVEINTDYPEYDDNHIDCGTGLGEFSGTITGLTPGTLYAVRAYAKNEGNRYFYGNVLYPETCNVGSIKTKTILNNLSSGEISTGYYDIVAGCDEIIDRGICWGTSTNPTGNTIGGGINSTATIRITGLTTGITYYVRSFYENVGGDIVYGNEYNTSLTPNFIYDAYPVTLVHMAFSMNVVKTDVILDANNDLGVKLGTITIPLETSFGVDYPVDEDNNPTWTSMSNITPTEDSTYYYIIYEPNIEPQIGDLIN